MYTYRNTAYMKDNVIEPKLWCRIQQTHTHTHTHTDTD